MIKMMGKKKVVTMMVATIIVTREMRTHPIKIEANPRTP